jgi:hypothetical protein
MLQDILSKVSSYVGCEGIACFHRNSPLDLILSQPTPFRPIDLSLLKVYLNGKKKDHGENYITMNFVICILHRILLG